MDSGREQRRIGRYRLVRKIGQGGQGVVFLAEDPDGGKAAIKLLRDHGDEKARARFLKEVATARRIAPFCTAQILDVGEEDGAPYVATEYIDGPSLRELVEREGPRSGPELYRLAVGTATALAAIHQAGVVHRDFKPGNVLIGPDGPRVIDFGIARAVDLTATATGGIIGTPAYMAPEQFSGRDVGPPADVFAWAATIAYAANGRPPHGQDSVPAVMGRILKGKADLGRLDGPLYRLVADCLRRDPSRRPTSRQILMRLLGGQASAEATETLARGRDLAAADDATLVDGPAAQWTSLRATDRPVGGTAAKRSTMVSAAGALAVAVIAAVVFVPDWGDKGRSRAERAKPTPQPTAAAQISAAIEKATTSRRTYAFTVEGYNGQGTEGLNAGGKCQINSGLLTDCDINAGNDAAGEAAQRYILVGDSGYRADGIDPEVYEVERAVEVDEEHIHLGYARDARWVASPQNIVELVRLSGTPQVQNDRSGVTYHGKVPIQTMIKRDPVGGWYEQFRALRGDVNFTLVTSHDHLPRRMALTIRGALENSTVTLRATYTLEYQQWGTAGNVTKPF